MIRIGVCRFSIVDIDLDTAASASEYLHIISNGTQKKTFNLHICKLPLNSWKTAGSQKDMCCDCC